jgi:putative membrane protein insertion efficiency factor
LAPGTTSQARRWRTERSLGGNHIIVELLSGIRTAALACLYHRRTSPWMALWGPMAALLLVAVPTDGGTIDAWSPAYLAIRFYQKYISDLRYGSCRFDPSCSQYALEAIQDRGLFVGTSLAADRLVRCNGAAAGFYEMGTGGHLIDPVGGSTFIGQEPKVPAWLLPDFDDPSSMRVDIFSGGCIDSSTLERIEEYAEFGDMLAETGDCWRATTEYKRIAHICGSLESLFWSQLKTARCLYIQQEWTEAAEEFLAATELARDQSQRDMSCFMAAACNFNAGNYARSRRILDRSKPGLGGPGGRMRAGSAASVYPDTDTLDTSGWLMLHGLCSMALGDWNIATDSFGQVSNIPGKPPLRRRATYMAQTAREGPRIPRRSPVLASVLSTVLPGSGQVYSGRLRDGLRHLLFNSLLWYQVYRLAEDENYTATYLVTSLALPFYVGNILGARQSADGFNRSRRAEYVSRVIAGYEDS